MEKKYDCKIEFVYKSQTDYYNTLVQNCLAGQPTGDVINVGSSRLPDYARKGILEPLEGYDAYKQYLGNQLSKKASDWMSLDGKTYGMCAEPLEQRMFVTFNKRIFKENNLDDPYELAKAGNWTWEKFTEYSQKMHPVRLFRQNHPVRLPRRSVQRHGIGHRLQHGRCRIL